MAEHNEIGNLGESIAADFLMQNGYSIRETQYRFQKWEIDIIAELEDIIVFVEVKTRSSTQVNNPEDAVNQTKKTFLLQAADQYLQENNIEKEARFDIISIVLDGNKKSIHHIEDAFNSIH